MTGNALVARICDEKGITMIGTRGGKNSCLFIRKNDEPRLQDFEEYMNPGSIRRRKRLLRMLAECAAESATKTR
jgi:hypothetical protein